jgi:phosphatidyl-myo-inositol alpha-mannosyltransferase
MRVSLISPYALSVFGGVQEQVLSMSRELTRLGHVVQIVAPDSSDSAHYDTPAVVERFGTLMSLPANGSRAPLALSPFAARQAARAVDSFNPDVVHFHEPFAPLLGWGVLRRHHVPNLATFHRSGGGPALSLTKPLLRYLARNLDATTAVSAAAASTIKNACGIDATVLFNGFETARFRTADREKSSETTIVTVGRLEERKGTRYLVDAVMRHNEASPAPWRLVVIGDGPERGGLERISTADHRISFVGAVSDEEKRLWLRRSDVAVCPALRGESFGLVLLEAMAAETPVVASDIEGYREASGGHAVLCPPANAAALETAIERGVQMSPEALEEARRHAEGWSMSSLVSSYEALYRSAIEDFLRVN